MPSQQKKIENFFKQYALRFNTALSDGPQDIDGVVNSFAEYFIEATPLGINGGKNDETFRQVIPKGWAFYKEIGITSMNILGIDITMLDDFHAIAKIHWDSVYRKKDNRSGNIEFDVIYLVQLRKEGIKIFAYITGDEQKVLKEHGLLLTGQAA